MFQVRSSSVVKECLWGQLLHSNVLQTIWDFSQSTNYDRDICFLISTQIWYSILHFWCLSNFSCSLKIMFWFPIIATFVFIFFIDTNNVWFPCFNHFIHIVIEGYLKFIFFIFECSFCYILAPLLMALKVVLLKDKTNEVVLLLFHVISYINFLLDLHMLSQHGWHCQFFICSIYKVMMLETDQ